MNCSCLDCGEKKSYRSFAQGLMGLVCPCCPSTTADTRLCCANEKPLSLKDELSLQFWLSQAFSWL